MIAAHLANCAVERGFRDEIRRVRKIDERKPIDAVPAMALAVWRATQRDLRHTAGVVRLMAQARLGVDSATG